jgi:hypothetical protein
VTTKLETWVSWPGGEMVEKIADMPAGTIGFRASGKLTTPSG